MYRGGAVSDEVPATIRSVRRQTMREPEDLSSFSSCCQFSRRCHLQTMGESPPFQSLAIYPMVCILADGRGGLQTVHTQLAMWWNLAVLAAVACNLASGSIYDGSILGRVAGDKQIFNEKARFIKFDTKDDEVEIDLGFSVPLVKVPLQPKAGRDESGVTVSVPGLVVAGVLVLTTFLIIPLLFSTKTYKDFRTDDTSIVEDVQKAAQHPCLGNLLCRTVKSLRTASNATVRKTISNVIMSGWLSKLVNGTFVEKAIASAGNASECPGHCGLSRKRTQPHKNTIK